MKKIFIDFKRDSGRDELLSDNGELIGADNYFSDDSESDQPQSTESERLPVAESLIAGLPDGASVIGCHRPVKSQSGNILYRNVDGSVSFLSTASPYPHSFGNLDIPDTEEDVSLILAATVDDWIVLLPEAGGDPLYALWNYAEGKYTKAQRMISFPSPTFSMTTSALPGYCALPGDYPAVTLSFVMPDIPVTEIKAWLDGTSVAASDFYKDNFSRFRQEIESGIQKAWCDYLEDASIAGLHVLPVKALMAFVRKTPAGKEEILSPSKPVLLSGDFVPADSDTTDVPRVMVADYSLNGSVLRLTVKFSCRPGSIGVSHPAVVLPEFLQSVNDYETATPRLMLSGPIDILENDGMLRGLRNLPELPDGSAGHRGWSMKLLPLNQRERLYNADPVDEFGIDYGLHAEFIARGGTSFNSRLILFGPQGLRTSGAGAPLTAESIEKFEGEEIMALTPSCRSLSSGELGDFPLYAFCRDGIRALTPYNRGFRSVQLICRDVAAGTPAPAVTPAGVIFVSERGILHLEGSRTSSLGEISEESIAGLAWHYAADCAVAVTTSGRVYAYSSRDKEWKAAGFKAICFAVCWPDLYLHLADSSLWKAGFVRMSETGLKEPRDSIVVTGKAMKLGAPGERIRLLEVEMAPGADLPEGWSLEGSDDLRKWWPAGHCGVRRMRVWAPPFRWWRLRFVAGSRLPPGIIITRV